MVGEKGKGRGERKGMGSCVMAFLGERYSGEGKGRECGKISPPRYTAFKNGSRLIIEFSSVRPALIIAITRVFVPSYHSTTDKLAGM